VAISRNQFNNQKIDIIKNKDLIKDTQLVELQIRNYDPKYFSDSNRVDILSLYASLKEENDEKVEHALEELNKDRIILEEVFSDNAVRNHWI